MYKRVKITKLGKTESHRASLKRNLLRSLFEKNVVVTTSPKAKVLKKEASSLIAKAKMNKDSILFKRELKRTLGRASLVKNFVEYAEKEKSGVSIVKVGFRLGDNAEKSKVYLLGIEKKKATKKKDEKVDAKEVEKNEEKIDKKGGLIKNIFGQGKRVDKTAVVDRTERARTRAGL